MKIPKVSGDDIKTGAILLGSLYVLKKIADLFNSDRDKKGEEQQQEVDKVKVNASALTFLPATYLRVANEAFDNMNKIGEPEEPLFDMLKGFGTEDLKQLYKVFGTRAPAYPLWVGVNTVTLPAPYSPGDLIQWYKAELGKKYLLFGSDNLERMRKIWEPTKLWQ